MSADHHDGAGAPAKPDQLRTEGASLLRATLTYLRDLNLTAEQLLILNLQKRMERLEDKLLQTADGEPRTATATTPICESTAVDEKSDVCPACGQRLKPMTNAERQRRYRAKQASN